jgi:hypothetical protein
MMGNSQISFAAVPGVKITQNNQKASRTPEKVEEIIFFGDFFTLFPLLKKQKRSILYKNTMTAFLKEDFFQKRL